MNAARSQSSARGVGAHQPVRSNDLVAASNAIMPYVLETQ